MKNVLDDFQISSNVKLIIAHTTNTNTRCKNDVVSLLKKACKKPRIPTTTIYWMSASRTGFTPQTCDEQCFNGKCDQS